MKKRITIALLVLVVLLFGIFVIRQVHYGMQRTFNKQLLLQISNTVKESFELKPPDDLLEILQAKKVYEWNAHLVNSTVLIDLWGTSIEFSTPDPMSLKIRSAGRDREYNTEDDQSVMVYKKDLSQQPLSPESDKGKKVP